MGQLPEIWAMHVLTLRLNDRLGENALVQSIMLRE